MYTWSATETASQPTTACIYKKGKVWLMAGCDSVGREVEYPSQFDNKVAAKRAAKERNLKPWNY